MKDLCELKSLYSTLNAKFLKANRRRVDYNLIPAQVASTSDQVNPSSDYDPVISTNVVKKKRNNNPKNNNKRKRHIIGLAYPCVLFEISVST